MRVLLKNVDLYTPKHVGLIDLLIENGQIIKIDKNIMDSCETIDYKGKIVCPMLVDGHEHLKDTQNYNPNDILTSGVGSVVGCLADEQSEECCKRLIEVTKELRDKYNVDAYCLAGSKNCLYDTKEYILKNACVVGIKTALFSNGRPKPNLSYDKLKQDALSTYIAGIKAGKKVQVHIHLDHPFPRGESADISEINSGKIDNLHWIDKIVEETGVPYSLFKLTHAQKYYDRILEYANKGCFIDYTAFEGNYDCGFDCLIGAIKSKKVDLSKISISSDLGILTMERGLKGKETPITILNTIQKLVLEKGLNFEDVLRMVTINALKPITNKEELIFEGALARLVVLSKDIQIEEIIFNGKFINIKQETNQECSWLERK